MFPLPRTKMSKWQRRGGQSDRFGKITEKVFPVNSPSDRICSRLRPRLRHQLGPRRRKLGLITGRFLAMDVRTSGCDTVAVTNFGTWGVTGHNNRLAGSLLDVLSGVYCMYKYLSIGIITHTAICIISPMRPQQRHMGPGVSYAFDEVCWSFAWCLLCLVWVCGDFNVSADPYWAHLCFFWASLLCICCGTRLLGSPKPMPSKAESQQRQE